MNNNTVYLVSLITVDDIGYVDKSFKLFYDYDIALAYKETLINDYKTDVMKHNDCSWKEIDRHIDVGVDTDKIWYAISHGIDVTIEITEMQVY